MYMEMKKITNIIVKKILSQYPLKDKFLKESMNKISLLEEKANKQFDFRSFNLMLIENCTLFELLPCYEIDTWLSKLNYASDPFLLVIISFYLFILAKTVNFLAHTVYTLVKFALKVWFIKKRLYPFRIIKRNTGLSCKTRPNSKKNFNFWDVFRMFKTAVWF